MPSDACFCALAAASPSFCVAAAIAATATAVTRAQPRHAGTLRAMRGAGTRRAVAAEPCMPLVRVGGAYGAKRRPPPIPWMGAP